MCKVSILTVSLNNTVIKYFFFNNTAEIYSYIEFNTKLILTESCSVFPACNYYSTPPELQNPLKKSLNSTLPLE